MYKVYEVCNKWFLRLWSPVAALSLFPCTWNVTGYNVPTASRRAARFPGSDRMPLLVL